MPRTGETSAPGNPSDGPPDVDLLTRLDAGDPHAMRLLYPPGSGADEAALESVFAGQVRAALHRLPLQQRQTLLLAYYGGYPYREISELVEVPLGTVKSRIFLGVQRLRILLRPLLDAPPTA